MYLDIPMLIYEQVFRLQVSVDEVQGVKVLKGEYYLSCIKFCMWFTERMEGGQSDTGATYEHRFLLSEGANAIIHRRAALTWCLSQAVSSMTLSDWAKPSKYKIKYLKFYAHYTWTFQYVWGVRTSLHRAHTPSPCRGLSCPVSQSKKPLSRGITTDHMLDDKCSSGWENKTPQSD